MSVERWSSTVPSAPLTDLRDSSNTWTVLFLHMLTGYMNMRIKDAVKNTFDGQVKKVGNSCRTELSTIAKLAEQKRVHESKEQVAANPFQSHPSPALIPSSSSSHPHQPSAIPSSPSGGSLLDDGALPDQDAVSVSSLAGRSPLKRIHLHFALDGP